MLTVKYAPGFISETSMIRLYCCRKGCEFLNVMLLFSNPTGIKIFQDMDKPSGRFTHMTMIWGQFIDHDLTLAAPQKIDCPTQGDKCTKEPNRGECFGIPVPENDPHFPNVGVKCLHLVRSAPACNSKWRPREQVHGGIVTLESIGPPSPFYFRHSLSYWHNILKY